MSTNRETIKEASRDDIELSLHRLNPDDVIKKMLKMKPLKSEELKKVRKKKS